MDECIRRGKPPPESIQNAPELNAGLGLYYVAFLDLTGCRHVGEALGTIDWLMIDRYCQRYDIEGEQYEDMQYLIARMDAAFLEYYRSKSRAQHEAELRRIKSQQPKKGGRR